MNFGLMLFQDYNCITLHIFLDTLTFLIFMPACDSAFKVLPCFYLFAGPLINQKDAILQVI